MAKIHAPRADFEDSRLRLEIEDYGKSFAEETGHLIPDSDLFKMLQTDINDSDQYNEVRQALREVDLQRHAKRLPLFSFLFVFSALKGVSVHWLEALLRECDLIPPGVPVEAAIWIQRCRTWRHYYDREAGDFTIRCLICTTPTKYQTALNRIKNGAGVTRRQPNPKEFHPEARMLMRPRHHPATAQLRRYAPARDGDTAPANCAQVEVHDLWGSEGALLAGTVWYRPAGLIFGAAKAHYPLPHPLFSLTFREPEEPIGIGGCIHSCRPVAWLSIPFPGQKKVSKAWRGIVGDPKRPKAWFLKLHASSEGTSLPEPVRRQPMAGDAKC